MARSNHDETGPHAASTTPTTEASSMPRAASLRIIESWREGSGNNHDAASAAPPMCSAAPCSSHAAAFMASCGCSGCSHCSDAHPSCSTSDDLNYYRGQLQQPRQQQLQPPPRVARMLPIPSDTQTAATTAAIVPSRTCLGPCISAGPRAPRTASASPSLVSGRSAGTTNALRRRSSSELPALPPLPLLLPLSRRPKLLASSLLHCALLLRAACTVPCASATCTRGRTTCPLRCHCTPACEAARLISRIERLRAWDSETAPSRCCRRPCTCCALPDSLRCCRSWWRR